MLNIVVMILDPVNEGEPGDKPLLIDTVFLDSVNSVSVGQAIVNTVVNCKIKYNIRLVMSDNARYMIKCVNDVLKPLFPKMVHSTCWAHIISLVGSKWVDVFAEVNSFVADMKSIFVHSAARKRRYESLLKRLGKPVKLAPQPVLTRWNSWFEAVAYHADYFDVYAKFIAEETEEGSVMVSILGTVYLLLELH